MQGASKWGWSEKVVIGLTVLLIVAVSVSKTLAISKIQGQDFWAYHQAGERFLRGENPYVATDAKAYKYAPTLLPLFAFFALFPLSVSLWIFAGVNVIVLTLLPLVTIRLFERGAQVSSNERTWALVLGIVASLRFIDGEIYNAQINGWSLAFILGAVALWTHSKARLPQRILGAVSYAVGAFFKFHPLLGLGAFCSPRTWKSCAFLSLVVVIVALVPSPSLWVSLVNQLRATTPLIESHEMSAVYQGFYGFFSNFFSIRQGSLLPFGTFAVVAAAMLPWVPKFSLLDEMRSPASKPAAFLPALASLLMLGVTASPLPWQHTYLVWGSFVPLAYLAGSPVQRRLTIGLALFMGLSARGIAGFTISNFFELHQSLFFLSLALAAILLSESRRLYFAS